ncbi:MAG: hypothetical protein ABJE95_35560, partial [Byssovorax sp.]
RKRLETRADECAAQREKAAKDLEIARVRDEKAREEQRVKKDLEQKCDALAGHVDTGSLTPDDTAFAAARAPLLRRVAQSALDPADFGPDDPDLPCAGSAASARLDAAFTRAVLASPARWANADDPSKVVTALLIAHVADLPGSAKQVVAHRADDLARKALIIGVPGLLPRAIRLCKLKDALGIRGGSFCAGALFSAPK